MKKRPFKKFLITGASGILGSNLAFFYRTRFELAGVYLHHFINLPGIKMVKTDLLSLDQTRHLIEAYNPDAVIHCAALPNIDQCEINPSEAHQKNVLITQNIVRSLQGRDKKLVFISTDYVYDIMGNHGEDELLTPVNEYGRSKLLAENSVLSLKGSAVLRTTFFGCGTCFVKTHSEQMILSLLQNEKFRGFDDVFFSPIYVSDLSVIIEKVISKDLAGVFNVGAPNGVSKYDLFCQIASSLGLDANLIEPISVDSLSLPAARNKNAVMKMDRISAALGMGMPDTAEGSARFANDLKKGIILPGSALENVKMFAAPMVG